jgi:hypothetical protein
MCVFFNAVKQFLPAQFGSIEHFERKFWATAKLNVVRLFPTLLVDDAVPPNELWEWNKFLTVLFEAFSTSEIGVIPELQMGKVLPVLSLDVKSPDYVKLCVPYFTLIYDQPLAVLSSLDAEAPSPRAAFVNLSIEMAANLNSNTYSVCVCVSDHAERTISADELRTLLFPNSATLPELLDPNSKNVFDALGIEEAEMRTGKLTRHRTVE